MEEPCRLKTGHRRKVGPDLSLNPSSEIGEKLRANCGKQPALEVNWRGWWEGFCMH